MVEIERTRLRVEVDIKVGDHAGDRGVEADDEMEFDELAGLSTRSSPSKIASSERRWARM